MVATERPSLYLETSVVSYLSASPSRDVVLLAQQQLTREWWDSELPKFRVFISPVVVAEARRGDACAAQRRLQALEPFERLSVTGEAEALAETYLREGVLPGSASIDALHLSLACVHEVDYPLTWNCRHIASGEVRRRLQRVNERLGVWIPIICTPAELVGGE